MAGWIIALKEFLGLVPKILGNKESREKYQYKAQAAAMQQLAAEFNAANRTWVDSIVDGFNRMVRPVIVGHVVASFWYLILNPEGFGILMAKLSLAPDWYAHILMGVLLFWFGARPFEKAYKKKFDVENFLNSLEKIYEVEEKIKADKKADVDYEKEMEDTETPLSNEAIMEWNRRNGGQSSPDDK